MAKNFSDQCPFLTTQTILEGKWALVVLYHLSTGTKRFKELERLIEGISQPVLSKQLRYLEERGLITRTVYPQVPPRVDYALSDLGRAFEPVLDQIEVFGKYYLEAKKE